jgi:hypothetical protein
MKRATRRAAGYGSLSATVVLLCLLLKFAHDQKVKVDGLQASYDHAKGDHFHYDFIKWRTFGHHRILASPLATTQAHHVSFSMNSIIMMKIALLVVVCMAAMVVADIAGDASIPAVTRYVRRTKYTAAGCATVDFIDTALNPIGVCANSINTVVNSSLWVTLSCVMFILFLSLLIRWLLSNSGASTEPHSHVHHFLLQLVATQPPPLLLY